MMLGLLGLVASPIGRYVTGAVAAVAMLAGIYYAGKSAGRSAERLAQSEATAAAARERVNVETDIRRLPGDDLDRMLDEWRRQ